MPLLFGAMPQGSYPERGYPDRYIIGVVSTPEEIVITTGAGSIGYRLPDVEHQRGRASILRDDIEVLEIIMCAMEVL